MAKKQNLNEIEDEVIVKKIELDEIDDEEEEEKEVTVMDMLNRVVICLIIIAVILAVNTVVLICKDGSGSKKEEANNATETTSNDSSTSNYDVSMMDEVDVTGALKLFDGKGTHVLYVGRANCGACVNYLPNLQDAQENLGYTTKYLDLNKLDTSSGDYEKLLNKLSVKYTMTISGEEKTETFGTWMGYTPMTIIIKDGKMVDGEIGSLPYESLIALLKENGIQ